MVEVRDYEHHTGYEIRSATERMLSTDVRTYNKYVSLDQRPTVFVRRPGMFRGAVVAAAQL